MHQGCFHSCGDFVLLEYNTAQEGLSVTRTREEHNGKKLLNASDFFKGGYNFLAPTDAWEKSDDTILRHRKATRPRSKVQNGGLQRRIF